MEVIEQGKFQSLYDVSRLRIIDFNRCNGLWGNDPARAMQAITQWMIGTMAYTIIKVDMELYPQRDDFPGWNHIGHHEALGRIFWNCFMSTIGKDGGTLTFQDAPDFVGTIPTQDTKIAQIYGDFGQISASAFGSDVLPQLKEGDLFISIPSTNKQIVLEPLIDIGKMMKDGLTNALGIKLPASTGSTELLGLAGRELE